MRVLMRRLPTGSRPAPAPARDLPRAWGRDEFSWALRIAVVPWLVARVVVGGALGVAHELVDGSKPLPAVAARVHQGLLGWDAGWYESIARHGYSGAGHSALRFFPLVPLLTRALAYVPGIGVGTALVLV